MKIKIVSAIIASFFLIVGVFLASLLKPLPISAACCVEDCCTESGCQGCCVLDLQCEGGIPGGGGGGGGGGVKCQATSNCPAGTYPDWSQSYSCGCVHWGHLCGDAITRGGSSACCVGGDPPCKESPVLCATCVPSCDATAATNITVTPTSITSTNVTWTLGANGTAQWIYIGSNKANVQGNCVDGCEVVDSTLTASQNSYQTEQVLSPNTVYYYKIVTYKGPSCVAFSSIETALSSCSLSPSSLSLTTLDPPTTLATSVVASSEISQVAYSSSDPGVATVTTPDLSSPYATTVTPISPGSTVVTSDVYFGAELACSDTASVNVLQPGPWWQVMDADLGSLGNLTSLLPNGQRFNLPGAGGYPGIPAYSGSTNLTPATVSDEGWIAESPTSNSKMFDYSFFASQIPADTQITQIPGSDVDGSFFESGGAPSYGYYWYKYSGGGVALNINTDMNLTNRRVVLLVEDANLNLNGTINLNDGEGFFGVFVNGDISVNPLIGGGLPDLEGTYLADGSFSTGLASDWLYIRGSVTAYGGLLMQRDLGGVANALNPSEFFEFAPDQILLFPAKMGYRRISWKEVAP